MPILTPGDVHVNRPLTILATALRQNQDRDFVSDKVFPNIPVDKQTDFFYRMASSAYMQTNAAKRAPGTETRGVEWTFTKDTYAAEVWGLHSDVEDQFRANADENFRLDQAATELITAQMLLRREKEWYANYFKTGVWSLDWTGVSGTPTGQQIKQFDQAGSTPIQVFRKASTRFMLRTGVRPNFVVLGPDVWDALLDHPDIIDRVKYTQGGFLTNDLVARAIGIDNVYTGSAVESTVNDEDTSTFPTTGGFMAGKSMLIGYSAPRAARNVPSAGYTFSWTGYAGANAWGGRVKKYRMESVASDRIEIEAAWGMKIVAPQLGEFYSSVVS